MHFWRKLRSKDLPENYLSHVHYALLGLGDTNYTTFLGFPKGVDKQLQRLGAKPFLNPGWADDAVGLEIVVDPWIESLMSSVQNSKYLLEYQPPPPIVSSIISQASHPEEEAAPAKTDLPTSDIPQEKISEKNVVENLVTNLRKLVVCSEQLDGTALKIPVLPTPFLDIVFNAELKVFQFEIFRTFDFLTTISSVGISGN